MVLTNLYFLVFQVSPNETSGCCDTASNPGYIDKAVDFILTKSRKLVKTKKQNRHVTCFLF